MKTNYSYWFLVVDIRSLKSYKLVKRLVKKGSTDIRDIRYAHKDFIKECQGKLEYFMEDVKYVLLDLAEKYGMKLNEDEENELVAELSKYEVMREEHKIYISIPKTRSLTTLNFY